MESTFHVKNPNMPQFRFEWHPGKKIVYVIRLDVTPLIGEAIAHDIENSGSAINAMLIWCRGYKTAKLELQPKEVSGG